MDAKFKNTPQNIHILLCALLSSTKTFVLTKTSSTTFYFIQVAVFVCVSVVMRAFRATPFILIFLVPGNPSTSPDQPYMTQNFPGIPNLDSDSAYRIGTSDPNKSRFRPGPTEPDRSAGSRPAFLHFFVFSFALFTHLHTQTRAHKDNSWMQNSKINNKISIFCCVHYCQIPKRLC